MEKMLPKCDWSRVLILVFVMFVSFMLKFAAAQSAPVCLPKRDSFTANMYKFEVTV